MEYNKSLRVNDNKIIHFEVVESPSFHFDIVQHFCDVVETERLIKEGLPIIPNSSVLMSFTHPEMCALTNFCIEYMKDFQKAHELMVIKENEAI
jgi:hypothetical protein